MGLVIKNSVNNKIYSVGAKSPRLPYSFSAIGTELSMSFSGQSHIHSIVLELPSFTNSPTATLTIVNDQGVELYNSGAKADRANYVLLVDRIVAENNGTFVLTLSGDAGGSGGTAYISIYNYIEEE